VSVWTDGTSRFRFFHSGPGGPGRSNVRGGVLCWSRGGVFDTMMPAYHPDSHTITGCREFSPLWWHEFGHHQFEKKTGLQEIHNHHKEDFFFFMIIGAYYQNPYVFFAGVFLYVLPMAYFEIWAWAYALRHKAGWA
jgi:hypothetical protein